MSRHFYLPPRASKRPVGMPVFRISGRSGWIGLLIVLAVGITGWLILTDFAVFSPSPATTRAGSALREELSPAAKLSKDALRPTDESGIKESSAAEESVEYAPGWERPIRIQVLNGCGVKGLAKIISPALRARGFDVRETRNAAHFRYAQSLLMDRTGRIELAYAIADSLGLERSRVTSEPGRNLVDIDVTLIVGADWESLRLDTKK